MGQVMVDVAHVAEPVISYADSPDWALSQYVLDSHLRVIGGELGERYPSAHVLFEQRGLLPSPYSAEAERKALWPVLRWDGTGFQSIIAPEALQ